MLLRPLLVIAFGAFLALGLLASMPTATASDGIENLQLTATGVGYLALAIFVIAYAVVMSEEFIDMRKSKPVLVAAGAIWVIVALSCPEEQRHNLELTIEKLLSEYAELFLFLLVAMTYINAMGERHVFEAMRSWLSRRGFTCIQLFWITGILSFFISPIADNLTTALLMCAVVMAVGVGNPRFVGLGCINIVVAANAGGAFSPFGDITTLLVWQQGHVEFFTFFKLFVPSVVNYIVPAACMHFAVPRVCPTETGEHVPMKRGARRIMFLFLATITTAVCFYNFLHLPPALGMMTGLGYLKLFGFYLKKTKEFHGHDPSSQDLVEEIGQVVPFDIFRSISRAEWDTLFFFYGVIMCVGGLGFLGYLELSSEYVYGHFGHTWANVLVGVLSAIIDNIPVMFAVLGMGLEMDQGQWLLVTLTAGVGGSLLSIGSAAGVALMGQSRGLYTFFGHLKWTPAIALGYVASILVHLWVNSAAFSTQTGG